MKKNLDPHSPEVVEAILERVRRMTPEEALAFLMYRTPGIDETDMTGMFSNGRKPQKSDRVKRSKTAA